MFQSGVLIALLTLSTTISESRAFNDADFKMSMARTYASRDEILRQWESEQDSIRLCNRIINGEQDRPLSSMSRPGFVFRTLAMANCIVFSDVVTLPRVVVRDYIKAYRIVTDKNTSQDDYWLRVFTLPFTVITTIVNQPARTLTKLFSLAVGSAMSYPAVGGGNRPVTNQEGST